MSYHLPAVALAAILAVSACGGGSETASPAPTASAVSGQPDPSKASEPAPSPSVAPVAAAAEVVKVLVAAGLPVVVTTDYDETTDPNKQLGRPGGYVDKLAFTDSRIVKADVLDDNAGSVELGGGVELFADTAGAQTRADYIQQVTAGMPALTEYGYVRGGVLLRLSKQLTPTQAKAYEAALQSLPA